MKSKKNKIGLIGNNRKAYYNYAIIDDLEAGIVLKGQEVKSLREHSLNFGNSFILVRDNEAKIYNLNIANYSHSTSYVSDPIRSRKLLLHKSEILKLLQLVKEKRVSLIPLKIYFNKKNIAKVKIGIGKPKTNQDKREQIKLRDAKRDLKQRTIDKL